jgi:hypothetical protein
LEYAAATPTEAVTMRNAPHIIMERNTVWFTPSILKKSFDIAYPTRMKIASEIPYDKILYARER